MARRKMSKNAKSDFFCYHPHCFLQKCMEQRPRHKDQLEKIGNRVLFLLQLHEFRIHFLLMCTEPVQFLNDGGMQILALALLSNS